MPPNSMMPGVLWFISTPAHSFDQYEVRYNSVGIMAVSLPAPPMVKLGLTRDLWPGMTAWQGIVSVAGAVLEVWAGTNEWYEGIDVYHRFVMRDIVSPNIFSHYVVLGSGTEPVHWYYGTQVYCLGQLSLDGVTLVRGARM